MVITVWAGNMDIYAIEHIALRDPQDIYQEVCRRLLEQISQDFGPGASIRQVSKERYEICVDKVLC